jgi:hypothetical protein
MWRTTVNLRRSTSRIKYFPPERRVVCPDVEMAPAIERQGVATQVLTVLVADRNLPSKVIAVLRKY